MNEAEPAGENGQAAGRPLDGVTVLDLGQIYNGPYAGFMMAMGGARVIKIEPPGGEKMRRRVGVGGAMLPFAMLNSNKEFVSLDLKAEAGKQLFLDLVARADVVIENFAPGVMDRLGLGPEVLMKRNPRLVYGAGSGYGWSGPYRDYLAMDLTVQAMAGVIASTGYPDRPPVKAGPALCDFFAGVHLYSGIMTALFDRSRTGKGRFVEVSMLEAVYPALSSTLGLYYGSQGTLPTRTGNRHGGLAESPYNVYPASDGWLALICTTDAHWLSLTEAMGQPELKEDPRFTTLKDRVQNMDAIDQYISSWSSTFTRTELFDVLTRYRVPSAPVREIGEVIADPHMHARGALRDIDHPEMGPITLPTGALRFGGLDPIELKPSKPLGSDNEAIYKDWLGLSDKEYLELNKSKTA